MTPDNTFTGDERQMLFPIHPHTKEVYDHYYFAADAAADAAHTSSLHVCGCTQRVGNGGIILGLPQLFAAFKNIHQ